MTTIRELIELLSTYDQDSAITNEQNQPFIHIINQNDGTVLLSTVKPIGYCNRGGYYVYPSVVDGYPAFCPELDEDLYSTEWTPLKNIKK